ncbi:MAG: DUF6516 family protein [Bacteroidetes bacterium]|nr:DUF6516 family protein [Bacteroidota bacterium]
MLPEKLSLYLNEVESILKSLKDCYFEKYEEEILTPNRINLRIRIRFLKGYLLELNEAVILEKGELQNLSYRYHFQDGNNKLIFRYDNTPHFSDLENFPNHKHDSSGVIGINKPLITELVASVIKQMEG